MLHAKLLKEPLVKQQKGRVEKVWKLGLNIVQEKLRRNLLKKELSKEVMQNFIKSLDAPPGAP